MNKQVIGLTADQTQQKRGLVNWKIGQQKNNQIETEEKRLDTYLHKKGERKRNRENSLRDRVKRTNICGT